MIFMKVIYASHDVKIVINFYSIKLLYHFTSSSTYVRNIQKRGDCLDKSVPIERNYDYIIITKER